MKNSYKFGRFITARIKNYGEAYLPFIAHAGVSTSPALSRKYTNRCTALCLINYFNNMTACCRLLPLHPYCYKCERATTARASQQLINNQKRDSVGRRENLEFGRYFGKKNTERRVFGARLEVVQSMTIFLCIYSMQHQFS